MSTKLDFPYSISQVKKAGQTLRRAHRGDPRATPDKVAKAEEIAKLYRAVHQYPLNKANMGLRSMVASEGCQLDISQRLKRWPTIVDKICQRETSLPLSSMQDIGGCRAIVDTIEEVRRVEARLRHRRPILDSSDYIKKPRDSGYRGLHVVVEYDGRAIEIQLRTKPMHEWAITMEQLGSTLGMFLKTEGDHPVQKLMAAISEAMALEESGTIVGETLLSTISQLRNDAFPSKDT